MEILIKLDKRLYGYAKRHTLTFGEIDEICDAITNGVQLPKGHGRLIDADELPLNDIDNANHGSNYIRIAPAIIEIEADKEE